MLSVKNKKILKIHLKNQWLHGKDREGHGNKFFCTYSSAQTTLFLMKLFEVENQVEGFSLAQNLEIKNLDIFFCYIRKASIF